MVYLLRGARRCCCCCRRSNIQVLHVERIIFDELGPRFDIIAHEDRKQTVDFSEISLEIPNERLGTNVLQLSLDISLNFSVCVFSLIMNSSKGGYARRLSRLTSIAKYV